MNSITRVIAGACLALLPAIGPVRAVEVTVEVTNLSEENGFWFSPVWVGFHDGSFDLFDESRHLPPDSALERLVEDANPQPLIEQFNQEVPGGTTGVVDAPGGVADLHYIGPGETGRATLTVDPLTDRYFSYAAMLMPSNDAFMGNDNPRAWEVFNESGNMHQPFVIHVNGCDIWDAGTEVNTQRNATFFDQTMPDSGVETVAPVEYHEGFEKPYPTTPIIMGATNDLGVYFDPAAADFVEGNRPVARIVIIPEPTTSVLLLGGLVLLRRRRRILAGS